MTLDRIREMVLSLATQTKEVIKAQQGMNDVLVQRLDALEEDRTETINIMVEILQALKMKNNNQGTTNGDFESAIVDLLGKSKTEKS